MKRFMAPLSLTIALLLMVGLSATLAEAQESEGVPRVGFLGTSADNSLTQAFQQGLRDLGYVEGENIVVDYRFNEGIGNRLPGLATELVELQPDVMVAAGALSAQALKVATSSIPIVFAINPDAVGIGLVDDNDHPGGNLTGFTTVDPDEYTKQLLLLKRIVPGLSRVAFLADLDIAETIRGGDFPLGPKEAAETGLVLQGIGLRTSELDLDNAFESAKQGGAQALLVLQQPVTGLNRHPIAQMAIEAGLPALFWADAADDDWLATYGSSLAAAAYRTASYVDQIVQGQRVNDLPVQSNPGETLVVNLDTATALNLTIPGEVLNQADRVIGG